MSKQTKKVAIFDLDGTLVSAHLWLGMIKYYFKNKKNRFPAFWYIFSHLGLMPLWRMRLLSTKKYYQMWGRDIINMIKGLELEEVKELFRWLSNEYLLPTLKNKTAERLKKHQQEGYLTILASGTFQELTNFVARQLKIDFSIGTEYEINANKVSGKIIPPFCFAEGKVEKLKNFFNENNLRVDFKESFAYSDGFFDLPILELVGNPVVVDPDKELLKIAQNKGWQII